MYRLRDVNGQLKNDFVTRRDENVADAEALLTQVMAQGKTVAPLPSLEQSRAAFLEEFSRLPEAVKSIRDPEHYSVEFSAALKELRDAVSRKVTGAE